MLPGAAWCYLFPPTARLVIRLLYPILLFMRPPDLATLPCCSVVILRCPFSTHARESRDGTARRDF